MSELAMATVADKEAHPRSRATLAFERMLLCAVALCGLGWVTILSIGQKAAGPSTGLATKQAIYVALAVAAGAVTRRVGWRWLLRHSRQLLLASLALLVLVKLPGVPSYKGRWLRLGPLGSFQPSEAAKLLTLLHCVLLSALAGDRLREFKRGFLPAMSWLLLTVGLVLAAPDLGQSLLVLVAGSAVLLVSGLRTWHLAPLAAAGIGAIAFMREHVRYVRVRLEDFEASLSHGVDPTSQVGQGLVALARGGVWGQGLGSGQAHLGYVPEVHNDFIMTAIGEQLGLWGTGLVVLLVAVFVRSGFQLVAAVREPKAAAIAFGVTFVVGLQAAINLAVITGSAPPKGMSFPFVSYGGSGLLMGGLMLGLCASIARDGEREEVLVPVAPESGPRWKRLMVPAARKMEGDAADRAPAAEPTEPPEDMV